MELPDYTNAVFIVPIEFGGIRSYATIHEQMAYEEDGLEPTGEYLIHLLHHRFGDCQFTIDCIADDSMEPHNVPSYVEQAILKMIGAAILEKRG